MSLSFQHFQTCNIHVFSCDGPDPRRLIFGSKLSVCIFYISYSLFVIQNLMSLRRSLPSLLIRSLINIVGNTRYLILSLLIFTTICLINLVLHCFIQNAIPRSCQCYIFDRIVYIIHHIIVTVFESNLSGHLNPATYIFIV